MCVNVYDANERSVMHTLMTTQLPDGAWDMYVHFVPNTDNYTSSYTKLGSVETCEEWGQLWQYAHIDMIPRTDACVVLTERMDPVIGWSFFRRGVRPEWEDPANSHGVTLSARIRSTQNIWPELVVDCARGATPDEVMGVQVTRKPGRVVMTLKTDVWICNADTANVYAWLQTLSTQINFMFVPRQ